MALTFYNIKKWIKMLFGKSMLHVKQNPGKVYSFENVQGYYNDLTLKVLKDKKHINCVCPFPIKDEFGEYYFSTAIFQYGLALYDLLLLKNKYSSEEKFLSFAQWALENQNPDGSWNTFSLPYPNNPFGSMAQGEGASLLIRAYILSGNDNYLLAAKRALDFMCLPIDCGGTAMVDGDNIYFYEFTCLPLVYNGWIFSIFGLMDYVILTKDDKYNDILKRTIKTFINKISDMDMGYWSKYRDDKTIASPFYHNLHIAQLKVLAQYTHDETISFYMDKFLRYQRNPFYKIRAFFVKAYQKVK